MLAARRNTVGVDPRPYGRQIDVQPEHGTPTSMTRGNGAVIIAQEPEAVRVVDDRSTIRTQRFVEPLERELVTAHPLMILDSSPAEQAALAVQLVEGDDSRAGLHFDRPRERRLAREREPAEDEDVRVHFFPGATAAYGRRCMAPPFYRPDDPHDPATIGRGSAYTRIMHADPRTALVRILQGAASGELAAIHAYRGHAISVRDAKDKRRLHEIEADESHHRELVIGLLAVLGARPRPLRDALFFCIGKTIAFLCLLGGWFIPMYGAGKLERSNIEEYEHAARYALLADHPEMIDCILEMAEVEWEHERFFRERIAGHRLLSVFPMWSTPPPKETIRAPFAQQLESSRATA